MKKVFKALFTTNLLGAPNWGLWVLAACLFAAAIYRNEGARGGLAWILGAGFLMALASVVYNLRRERLNDRAAEASKKRAREAAEMHRKNRQL